MKNNSTSNLNYKINVPFDKNNEVLYKNNNDLNNYKKINPEIKINDNDNENKKKNKLLNKNDLEIKQRKRLNSQPLKSFKISSLAESKILSIICDNIFEDVNIDQNNDPSMINLSSNLILEENENKYNDNINKININEEENNMINSKTFDLNKKKSSKKLILEEENEIDLNLRTKVHHKKSYIFSNILKLKMTKCPRLLEEQWKYEKILLDYNIIDFTSKK